MYKRNLVSAVVVVYFPSSSVLHVVLFFMFPNSLLLTLIFVLCTNLVSIIIKFY